MKVLLRNKSRALRDLPHPVLFTQGSRWRFHTRRLISDTGHHFEIGNEIECVVPINNVSQILACSGDIHRWVRRSDETKYKRNARVRGTVDMNTIYRFVERIEPGTPVVYYVCKAHVKDGVGGFNYYYQGEDKNYPDVSSFAEAAYWENRLLALKALFRANNFGRHLVKLNYRYKLMAYDSRDDTHTEIDVSHISAASTWLNQEVGLKTHRTDSMRALTDVVLKNFDQFDGIVAVRMPSYGMEHEKTVTEFCKKMAIKKPKLFVNRLAFFPTLEDAMLVKMGIPGHEVITC